MDILVVRLSRGFDFTIRDRVEHATARRLLREIDAVFIK